jgi:hypothetical protein
MSDKKMYPMNVRITAQERQAKRAQREAKQAKRAEKEAKRAQREAKQAKRAEKEAKRAQREEQRRAQQQQREEEQRRAQQQMRGEEQRRAQQQMRGEEQRRAQQQMRGEEQRRAQQQMRGEEQMSEDNLQSRVERQRKRRERQSSRDRRPRSQRERERRGRDDRERDRDRERGRDRERERDGDGERPMERERPRRENGGGERPERELDGIGDEEFESELSDRQNYQLERYVQNEHRFINDFDRTNLSSDEIKAIRQERRQSFRDDFYSGMTEEQQDEFRENLGTYKMEQTSEAELLHKKTKRTEQKLLEQGNIVELPEEVQIRMDERNARKEMLASEKGVTRERPNAFRGIDPVRANVLKTIVRPEFQVSRHVDTIVRELEERNPGSIPRTMLAQASQMGQTPVTGRTFFPPQNANPTIVYPYTAKFSPPSRPLPPYVNWADSANIASVKGWRLPRSRLSRASRVSADTSGYLHEVVDQLGCGSCWSISVAGAMSDRASIWSQEENPQLSITNILGCVSGDGAEGEVVEGASMYAPATAGCAGGIPTGAVEMFANFGDATSGCVGYEWCENDPVCNSTRRLGFSDSPKYLNSIIPACADMLDTCIECEDGECEPSSRARTAWGLKTYESGRPYILLTDPTSIQQEIAAHGPVVATYAIYGDFQNGTAAIVGDGWAKTNGVYCNVQTEGSRKPYNGTRYAGSERQMIGYHAVVIVGWGVERAVPDWENPGSTFDLPYWIVRNSWGTQWNPECTVNGVNMPGYFKIAITDRSRELNTKVYLDTADDGLVGAAVAFMPMVVRVEPPISGPPQVDSDPAMHEEKLETSLEEEDVKIAALTQTELYPDMSEIKRDQLNHPISCQEDTPHDLREVNCGARLSLSASPSSTPKFVQWIPLVVIGIVTILLVTMLAIRMGKGCRVPPNR